MNATTTLIILLKEIKASAPEEAQDLLHILRRQYNLEKAAPIVHGVLGHRYDSVLYDTHSVGVHSHR